MISGYFKSAQDGRKLFYPWGAMGRGYVIASDQDYRRVKKELTAYIVISVVLSLVAITLIGYLAALVLIPVAIAFYSLWKPHLVRGLQPTAEELSLRESYTNQALARSAKELWSWEIAALVLFGVGILKFTEEGFGNRLIALALVVIAIFCAAFATWMLVLRRRATRSEAQR
jgi:hypothetical protein